MDHSGKVSKEVANKLALDQYEIYRNHRLVIEAKKEARQDDNILKAIEEKIGKKNKARKGKQGKKN